MPHENQGVVAILVESGPIIATATPAQKLQVTKFILLIRPL